jgi:hypothetical protein
MTDHNESVPPSVRLGEVVPPEDPEDWTSPLTWLMAAGMLAAPVVGGAWFAAATPTDPAVALGGTAILAAVVAAGAAITGATQRGALRAAMTTIGAALFGALGLVVAGNVVADGASLGVAVAAASAGGLATVPAAGVAGLISDRRRLRRVLSPAVLGGVIAALGVQNVFGP